MTGTRCTRFRRRDRCRPTGALAGALVALAVAAWPGATAAVVFSVDTALDTQDQNPGDGLCADAAGMCSLRAGVEEANALAGADTISLDVAGPYDLSIEQLTVTSDLTILGNGRTLRWVGGGGRLIQTQAGSLTLMDATLRDGNNNGLGGALHNNALTNLVRCTIIGNTNLQQGGGITNVGSTATLNMIDSAILNNSSGSDGGGLYNASGTVNIANSTISGNDADNEGGGIFSTFGAFNATNLTISRNVADHDADGTGSGGGIFQWGAAFAVRGTIVAGNFDTPGNGGPGAFNPDLAGQVIASQGYNLIGNVASDDFSSNTTGDHYGDPFGTTVPNPGAVEESAPIDPLLGGATGDPPLLRLLADSEAIDWIPVADCTLLSGGTNPLFNAGDPLTLDQEGDSRPLGARCDQGSDEARADAPLFSDGLDSGDTGAWSLSVP